jgi:superfamily II DNA/RNA helicase
MQARLLDMRERLMINRATSSLQMKTPIVEFITPDKSKEEKELTEEEQFQLSLKNVINNASWKLTDVLLATPVVMSHILESKEKYDPYDINPAVIVVDEFDELLQNPLFGNQMLKILRKFASFQTDKGNPLAEMNRMRQFIFTGATIPKVIATQQQQDALSTMSEWFSGGIKHLRTDNCHRVSPSIQQEWVDLQGSSLHHQTISKLSEDYDLNLLVDVIKRSLDVQKHHSILVFAESKKNVDRICEVLMLADIKSLPYYQDQGNQTRQTTLQLFFGRELPVMVCTNLAARGLDTMHVDHVIQFDFAKNVVDYLHRVGRTGRMGAQGTATHFVRQGDTELVERIRQSEGQVMDRWISRKRSFKKNIKRS